MKSAYKLALAVMLVGFSFLANGQDGNQKPDMENKEAVKKILDQIAKSSKVFEVKKEEFKNEVLKLFEKKEQLARIKGDIKIVNQIKKEKDAFLNENKEPTLFFITDQKRALELAKTEIVKSYDNAVRECIRLKFDFEAEELIKELEDFKKGKTKEIKDSQSSSEKNKTTYFLPGSVWVTTKGKYAEFKVTEVNSGDSTFKAVFGLLEVRGTVKDNEITWSSKDNAELKNLNQKNKDFRGSIKGNLMVLESFYSDSKSKILDMELYCIYPNEIFEKFLGVFQRKGSIANKKVINFIRFSVDKNNGEFVVETKGNETWNRIGWGRSGSTLMIDANNIDLFAVRLVAKDTISLDIYWQENKYGFKKTYLPNKKPNNSDLFFKVSE